MVHHSQQRFTELYTETHFVNPDDDDNDDDDRVCVCVVQLAGGEGLMPAVHEARHRSHLLRAAAG